MKHLFPRRTTLVLVCLVFFFFLMVGSVFAIEIDSIEKQYFKIQSTEARVSYLINLAQKDQERKLFYNIEELNNASSIIFLSLLPYEEGVRILNYLLQKKINILTTLDLLFPERSELSNLFNEKEYPLICKYKFIPEEYVRGKYLLYTRNKYTHPCLTANTAINNALCADSVLNGSAYKAERMLLVFLLSSIKNDKIKDKYADFETSKEILENIARSFNFPVQYSTKLNPRGPFYDSINKQFNFSNSTNVKIIPHEYAHCVFRQIISTDPKYQNFISELNALYIKSKNRYNSIELYQLVGEAIYGYTPNDRHGHPGDNLEEFFCSSFNVLHYFFKEFNANAKLFGENAKFDGFAKELIRLFIKYDLISNELTVN